MNRADLPRCVDCKYYWNSRDIYQARCTHPISRGIADESYATTYVMRASIEEAKQKHAPEWSVPNREGLCGYEGKLWEERVDTPPKNKGPRSLRWLLGN